MRYSIVGTGNVGRALAAHFARQQIRVAIANSRGPASIADLAKELGPSIVATTLDAALDADVVFFAVGFLQFKDIAAARADWSRKIVIDVTNAFMLPPEVQEKELRGRLSSEVNADRVPGAKLVKAFNQLPAKVLASPPPNDRGRRVIFISSDHVDASTEVAALTGRLGFAPIELGKIAEGGRLIQARGPLVLQHLVKYEQ
jgi:8-hydroxy-5-deazaflavin:NADPH oxidoreductase